MKSVLLCLMLPLSICLAAGFQHQLAARHAQDSPRLVLWSWEHKDNLQFVDPDRVAVAYYAGTIVLGRDTARLLKRKNRLLLNNETVRFPVFRIEKAHADEQPSAAALSSAIDLILKYKGRDQLPEIQVDFDAGLSDRQPYLQFLKDLKARLPAKTALSITALASWCLADKWLQAAPVDETVAMIFSLGPGKADLLSALARQKLDSGAKCKQSLGISISDQESNNELGKLESLKQAARIYAFSSLGWTKKRYEQLLAEQAKNEN